MTEAMEKNIAALAKLLGNTALAGRLVASRIAVCSGEGSDTASGKLLADALGDTLGRLWQRIDAIGPLGERVVKAALSAAESAGYQATYGKAWSPPYDYVIALGTNQPPSGYPTLRLGASGWVASAGARAFLSESQNPVGPALAAGLAGAAVFKTIFADALGDRAKDCHDDFMWNAWTYNNEKAESPSFTDEVPPLHFADLCLFGVGAVSHGLIWVLERWPSQVSGSLHLVDSDLFDQSNGQRYAGYRSDDCKHNKARVTAERLQKRHPQASFTPYECDMNTFFTSHRPQCRVPVAVAGLDSKEARRQLALKLPDRVVNMWTDGNWLGAARFGFDGQWPCLYCAYPEDTQVDLDETGELSRMTGLPPARVRRLLDCSEPLTLDDAQHVARKVIGSTAAEFVGKPLRSVQGHICATGKATLGPDSEDADVPFAFVSLLAGVFGFVELMRELQGYHVPTRWVYNTMNLPRIGCLEPTGPRPDCYLCSDTIARSIVASR